MLTHINIRNLRSIKKTRVAIAPITVLYGPNGSGKSTLMHALSIFKNIILNPNQPVDNFFNLGFASFGGFDQVVFNHIADEKIEFKIEIVHDLTTVTYGVSMGKKNGRFEISVGKPWNISLEIESVFPYATDKQKTATVEYEGTSFTINWNGIIAQVTSKTAEGPEIGKNAQELITVLNSPMETIRKNDFVHLKRGFSKPHYGTVALTPTIFAEDEIATLLANDRYLESAVSHYIEQILQRELRVRVTPGTNLFWINTTDKTTGLSTELVNDGFGINQVVYLLAKSLRKDISCVCIEEPEIHLHPKALRNLAYALVRLVKEEQKTMIISTHSEHFVLALLGAVSKKNIEPNEISCYLCTKDKRGSKFERQSVNEDGQVKGGLVAFMEGELEDIKDILGLSKKRSSKDGDYH